MVKLYTTSFAFQLMAIVILAGGALAQPQPGEYQTWEQLDAAMQALNESEAAATRSLGLTAGGRDIRVVTLGSQPGNSPEIAVVGSVVASHLLGAELCLRMAQQLVADVEAADDAAVDLLDMCVVHFIPCPSPDAYAGYFETPLWERSINITQADDDNDFRVDEDGFDDLNSDGLITMMRVEDVAGTWRTHPLDGRVMIPADLEKNEQGGWLLYSEGIDNDGDGRFNEDGPGGVDFNHNFPYEYPYFEAGAGDYQASEIETRALIDFLFDHQNIAVVYSFSPEDNLMYAWQPAGNSPRDGVFHTAVHNDDAAFFAHLAAEYCSIREEHGEHKGAPKPPEGSGSFTEWAYYFYGRWSVAARGWWIAEAEKPEDKQDSETEADAEPEEPADDSDKPEDVGDRGKDDLTALAWFAGQGIDGFVDWQPVEHPDFPGRTVEVGGFKPYLRLNPPVELLDGLAQQHYRYLYAIADMLPRLLVSSAEAEALGGDIYRVKVKVSNTGYLPTVPAMGEVAESHQHLQLAVELPAGAQLLDGVQRLRLGRLKGKGGTQEATWRVFAPSGGKLKFKVWSPSAGEASASLELESGEFSQGVE